MVRLLEQMLDARARAAGKRTRAGRVYNYLCVYIGAYGYIRCMYVLEGSVQLADSYSP